ncbi:MAG: hypothetical protein KKD44_29305 [Proteobacteria bacterium]|nr:hypothetical protein [Pseudomonadota bacterium]
MSRSYQEVGLKPEARAWLEENVSKNDQVCPECSHVISTKLDCFSYEKRDSFYGDGPSLIVYRLKDGREIREVVQLEPWSSGPMAFFCLEYTDTKERLFQWTGREVNEVEEGLAEDNDEVVGEGLAEDDDTIVS